MSNKPVGGRGKQAPYKTVVVRVPAPIANEITRQAELYRDLVADGTINPRKSLPKYFDYNAYTSPKLLEAIEIAKDVLKNKKSAKESVVKLLQVLYECEIDQKTLTPVILSTTGNAGEQPVVDGTK